MAAAEEVCWRTLRYRTGQSQITVGRMLFGYDGGFLKGLKLKYKSHITHLGFSLAKQQMNLGFQGATKTHRCKGEVCA